MVHQYNEMRQPREEPQSGAAWFTTSAGHNCVRINAPSCTVIYVSSALYSEIHVFLFEMSFSRIPIWVRLLPDLTTVLLNSL